MKQRIVPILLAVCLLLSGCFSWMDGQYVFTEPYVAKQESPAGQIQSVENYRQLCEALEMLVESSAKTGILSVENYAGVYMEANMGTAIRHIMTNTAIGAYAVEKITYELGKVGGVDAFAVAIEYSHSSDELRRILQLRSMKDAESVITSALRECEADVVMKIDHYAYMDFDQLIEDFAQSSPSSLMEIPQVSASVYPPSGGEERILVLRFTYQTSREVLRSMRDYVHPVFISARLYVSGEEEESVKFGLLYSFLMERYSAYTVETSITPTYSLLRHAVGDSRAFAVVYASMCKDSELECMVVSGTCQGEARVWNIICEDGDYYHVDLLRSNNEGVFRKMTDAEMEGYVWDYSAYPACGTARAATEAA